MIRLFNVYFSTRTLVRFLCEGALISSSFLLAVLYLLGPKSYIQLVYRHGIVKIVVITLITLLLSYYFNLYEPRLIPERFEAYFRLLLVLSALSCVLVCLVFFFPDVEIGHNVFAAGILNLSIVLVIWRQADEWLTGLPLFRERVYVLGYGARARTVVQTLRSQHDLGLEVVRWTGEDGNIDLLNRSLKELQAIAEMRPGINRVVVALEDRRGSMPIRELLNLRLTGVVIEDACGVFERLSGIIPLEGLNPSDLIFSGGFSIKSSKKFIREGISTLAAALGLMICLPIIPFIAIAVRLSSPGPILFRQTRVGKQGCLFTALKFRTMRQDAEANGAVWAVEDDPRITPLGRFMRMTRLDEIPQLWNVLRGDMAFVGPRPERPEFVQWLRREIPYYDLRHMVRPGITGWAQVRYKYGATLEESRRKLEYDLYYLKHLSIGLDLFIMFETIKTIVLQKGAQ